jgi:uncharacterized Zn finger protein (UPF0148 family)
MAAKFCTCGAKTEYTVKVPVFCSSCGQPYIKAFATTKIVVQESPKPATTVQKTITRSRPPENEDDDYIDKGSVQEMARELIASLSKDDFFSIEVREDRGVKLEDALDPKKQINIGQRSQVQSEASE